MREILFRGKRLDNGKWAQSRCPDGVMCGGTVIDDFDPATVGQYTGLTDKRGKRIFEGDILKWDEKEWPNFSEVVRWNYELLDVRKNDWAQFCKVIGNRWDNPELLGEEVDGNDD